MIPRAVMRVNYAHIEDYLDMGWLAHIPSTTNDLIYCYGIYMHWLCDCPPPTRRKESYDSSQSD